MKKPPEDCPIIHLFEREIHPHLDAVFRYAYSLTKNKPDAEDLAQNTLERAWKFIETYRPGTDGKKWLFRICYNLFCNLYRRRKRTPANNTVYDISACVPPCKNLEFDSPVEALITINTNKTLSIGYRDEPILSGILISIKVQNALQSLTLRQEEIVLLCLEGYRRDEIAEILNIPIGTVKSTYHRALSKLKKLLGEYAENLGYCPKEKRRDRL